MTGSQMIPYKVTREKIPEYDMTRSFPLTMQLAKGHLPKTNNQLYILYVYVLKYGWNVYMVKRLETHYNVWIAKKGHDHKCISLRFK